MRSIGSDGDVSASKTSRFPCVRVSREVIPRLLADLHRCFAAKLDGETDFLSFPRSAWECRPGRSASVRWGHPGPTTRSVEDGIPTRSIGTRDCGPVVEIREESRLYPVTPVHPVNSPFRSTL